MTRRLFLRVFAGLLVAPASLLHAGEWTARRVKVRATAYCPCSKCCGKHADGKTATGRDAYKAGIAVDSSVIPLGSRVDIPGHNRGSNGNGSWILADDTGGAIKGRRIDVRFKTHKEALEWGVKNITIRVWSKRRDS